MSELKSVRRTERIGATRDLVHANGYAEIQSGLISTNVSERDVQSFLGECRKLPPDPYMNTTHYRRSFGQILVVGDLLIPLPGISLTVNGKNLNLAGFNTGELNPQNPGPRLFHHLFSPKLIKNPFFRAAILMSVALDPLPAEFKHCCTLVQVFIQGAEVNMESPQLQAAPPDLPHNDGCRFKVVMLIGKHNVQGGVSWILPRKFSGKSFNSEMEKSAMACIQLNQPGHSYAFLDDIPPTKSAREANCHYVNPVKLDAGGPTGYRYAMTLTPVPLLPSSGCTEELKTVREHSLAVTSAYLDAQNIATALSKSEKLRLAEILGS